MSSYLSVLHNSKPQKLEGPSQLVPAKFQMTLEINFV